ncbi:MAG: hypothetical protein JOZ41_09930 [Chloroflexi bacterium]|nr:hypothetical protein [Chloroflexota bacterium]
MRSERLHLDPRRQQAVEELTGMIRARFPATSFAVRPGIEDPEETYLTATVDIDDPDEVMDLVVDRLLDLQMTEGIPVYVLPVHTPERALETMRQTKRSRKPSALLPPAQL